MDETAIDWSAGTWAGARREQLRQWSGLSLREKLLAMDELGQLAQFSMEEKARRNLPYFDPFTGELVRPSVMTAK